MAVLKKKEEVILSNLIYSNKQIYPPWFHSQGLSLVQMKLHVYFN